MSNQQPVCLVTGVNSGIGYATSLELAMQGFMELSIEALSHVYGDLTRRDKTTDYLRMPPVTFG